MRRDKLFEIGMASLHLYIRYDKNFCSLEPKLQQRALEYSIELIQTQLDKLKERNNANNIKTN